MLHRGFPYHRFVIVGTFEIYAVYLSAVREVPGEFQELVFFADARERPRINDRAHDRLFVLLSERFEFSLLFEERIVDFLRFEAYFRLDFPDPELGMRRPLLGKDGIERLLQFRQILFFDSKAACNGVPTHSLEKISPRRQRVQDVHAVYAPARAFIQPVSDIGEQQRRPVVFLFQFAGDYADDALVSVLERDHDVVACLAAPGQFLLARFQYPVLYLLPLSVCLAHLRDEFGCALQVVRLHETGGERGV